MTELQLQSQITGPSDFSLLLLQELPFSQHYVFMHLSSLPDPQVSWTQKSPRISHWTRTRPVKGIVVKSINIWRTSASGWLLSTFIKSWAEDLWLPILRTVTLVAQRCGSHEVKFSSSNGLDLFRVLRLNGHRWAVFYWLCQSNSLGNALLANNRM